MFNSYVTNYQRLNPDWWPSPNLNLDVNWWLDDEILEIFMLILWNMSNCIMCINIYIYKLSDLAGFSAIAGSLKNMLIPLSHDISHLAINMTSHELLAGGFNNLEKYESQWEGWHPISDGKLKMFQTTNQISYIMWYVMIHWKTFCCFPMDSMENPYIQWEFQDPKMELRKRTIFLAIRILGISPKK